MATLLEWNNGDPTAAGATIQGSVTVQNAGAFDEALITQSDVSDHLRWDLAGINQFTARMYVTLPASWGSSSSSIFRSISTGTTITSRINLAGSGDPGRLRWLRADNVQVATSPALTLLQSTTYRAEIQVDTVASTIRGAVFPLLSDTPIYDSGVISGSVGAAATAFLFGKTEIISSLPDFRISRLRVDDTVGSWIGRHASDASGAPAGDAIALWGYAVAQSSALLGIWNGSSLDLIETGSEIWVWHYDWTNNVWITPPVTRPSSEITRVMASGPSAPPTASHASWMGDSPEDWADGKAIVHYLWAGTAP